MKFWKSLFQWIKQGFKEDVEKIKAIPKGELELKFTGEQFKKYAFAGIKSNWLWLLIIVAAFFSGWMIAGAYYSVECSNMIGQVFVSVQDCLFPHCFDPSAIDYPSLVLDIQGFMG